jgi:hypothetical protein
MEGDLSSSLVVSDNLFFCSILVVAAVRTRREVALLFGEKGGKLFFLEREMSHPALR